MSETISTTNKIGLSKDDYKGGKSTLCVGCGHDSVTNHIINAFYNSNISPRQVAKMSGIGCSSKTPAYFLSQSHGINSLHGRMAPIAIGSKIAAKDLYCIGISGDGDSASIGIGGFTHLIRRNLPMVYLVYNNGVYGLTKGQFSATASEDSKLKTGQINPFKEMDLCTLAISCGATFVARTFSGDAKQMTNLLQAAIHHNGTAVIDIISPCITFNNHEGSTKSFNAVKQNKINLQELGFIDSQEEIHIDYSEGTTQEITLHDGSHLVLKKINQTEHDVHNKINAYKILDEAIHENHILTGLMYIEENSKSLVDQLNLCDKSLNQLSPEEMLPKKDSLSKILGSYK